MTPKIFHLGRNSTCDLILYNNIYKLLTNSSLFLLIRLDKDDIGHIHVLSLVLYRSDDLQRLVHFNVLLLVHLIRFLIEYTILEELYSYHAVNRGQSLRLDYLQIFVHKFDVRLVRNNRPVDVSQGLRALRTPSCLL